MRRLALSLALGLAAALLVAPPAQAATYGVSLAVNAAKADVGQTIRLTGTVSGKKAAKKTLVVQRRVGAGAWATIGKVRTSKKKTYVFNHRVSAVGAQQFRVIAPKKGKTAQGVSPARAFTGWTWLWLTQQPHASISSAYHGDPTCAGSICRPRSISSSQSGSIAFYQLARRCDASQIWFAIPDSTPPGSFGGRVYSDDGAGTTTTQYYPLTTGAWALSNTMVTPTTHFLTLYNPNSSGTTLLIGSPRVHCRVAELTAP